MPVLSGEEQDPGRRRAVFRVGQTPQRVLLLLPETRTSVRSGRRRRRRRGCRAPRQGTTVAVRGPPEPRHTRRRRSAVVGGRRVEVVQLGHAAGPATRGRRPPSVAKDHAQRAGPGVGVRRTTAVENQAAQDRRRKRADKTLKVVVQPVADSRVGTVQPVHAAAEKPLPADQAVQLALVVLVAASTAAAAAIVFLPAQHF